MRLIDGSKSPSADRAVPEIVDELRIEASALLKEKLIDLLRATPEGAEWAAWWRTVIALRAAMTVFTNFDELVMTELERREV